MTFGQVKRIEYTDNLWVLQEPYPALADLLTAKDCLIVLRNGVPPFGVVLGVPHQAEVGQDHICEDRERKGKRLSDENAASYALVAFTELGNRGIPCKLVIMAHSTAHDPNKLTRSPYCDEVFWTLAEYHLHLRWYDHPPVLTLIEADYCGY